jgi:hypothetical protein
MCVGLKSTLRAARAGPRTPPQTARPPPLLPIRGSQATKSTGSHLRCRIRGEFVVSRVLGGRGSWIVPGRSLRANHLLNDSAHEFVR